MGLSLFRRADAAAELPRLGGMARADGVVIVSERHWAFAGVDGSLREGTMPAGSDRLARVPLLRGLARLAASLSPLLRPGGVASGRERRLLLAALLAPLALAFAPHPVGLAGGIAVTVGLVAWLLRGRTLNLHGAEHRAINAAEQRLLAATYAGVARPSRIARRCGTNFAALVLPVTLLAERVLPLPAMALTPLLVMLVSLAVTMELWLAVQHAGGRLASVVLAPGLLLQRLTTREPSPAETLVALRALESVLARELG